MGSDEFLRRGNNRRAAGGRKATNGRRGESTLVRALGHAAHAASLGHYVACLLHALCVRPSLRDCATSRGSARTRRDLAWPEPFPGVQQFSISSINVD